LYSAVPQIFNLQRYESPRLLTLPQPTEFVLRRSILPVSFGKTGDLQNTILRYSPAGAGRYASQVRSLAGCAKENRFPTRSFSGINGLHV
jgi:hypothetical protein